jgi:hypothetical protein
MWWATRSSRPDQQLAPAMVSSSSPRTAAGATIGVAFLLMFWAAGDVILGLLVMFTRGKVSIIEETIE